MYICTAWVGEPSETDEMKPEWYEISNIPYDTMWKEDEYWLPEILKGKYIEAEFTLDDKDNVLKHNVSAKKFPA